MTPGATQRPPRTAASLFESCVDQHADEVAVDDRGRCVRYGELDARANRLARHLLATRVGADQIVALALPRSVDCVVAVLAVLKAGAAYLPLDLSYPPQRIAFMLEDARPVLTITTTANRRRWSHVLGEMPCLELDDSGTEDALSGLDPGRLGEADRPTPAKVGHAMYVVYTSGSTGTPKGVVVTGTGMAALADTQRRRLGVGPGSRVLQWSSIGFDAAFWDISTALFSGGTLVLAPEDRSGSDGALHDLLREGGITHATLPPAVLATLDDDVLPGATIVSTGDACTEALARRWSRGRRMINGYGPTETTIGATISEPYAGADVPIGRPFTDAVVHLLDDALRPVQPGDIGEIYVGGPGVARCYLGRPALTAARFVADPYSHGGRLYRTGDLASLGDDCQLIFRGRADDQVKIRGYRVEPGEVESVLVQHPRITQAAVVVSDDEHLGRHLVAYVVTDNCSPEDVRAYLMDRVPTHLVPGSVVGVRAIPVTPNGKVDREALPAVERAQSEGGAPLSKTERYLVHTISGLLGIGHVGRDDDFFDLGGHSLLAAELIGAIHKDLGVRLPVRTLYQASRVREIAANLVDASPPGHQNDTGSEL